LYPFIYNIIPVLAGVIDPVVGVISQVIQLFWHPGLPPRADSEARRRRGVTFILGGIEGPSRYNYGIGIGLLEARYRGAIVRFDWNKGIPFVSPFRNLMSRRHHETMSDSLVRAITEQARTHPDAPIHVIAQSGGCLVTVRALERLPKGMAIHTAVLIAPSISPAYDLALAAGRCTGRLIAVGSPGDFMFLGLGTTVFGTSDRVHAPSAGWVGWHYHSPPFVEARWHPSWLRLGNLGNHTSSAARRFISGIVAPVLMPASTGPEHCRPDAALTASNAAS
jgi:hypothetical protein